MDIVELSQRVSRKIKRIPNAIKTRYLSKPPVPSTQIEASLLAQYVKSAAETGIGTDECLKLGALPVPVHFYSPIPDIGELKKRKAWDKYSDMAGIDFRPDFQIDEIKRLGKAYGSECDWPEHETTDRLQFYTKNGSFSYGCAAALHCMIRDNKPKRVIEVGSGNSSRVINAALSLNANEGSSCDYTIIDPFPGENIQKGLPTLKKVIAEPVEMTNPQLFEQLEKDDILFIDSSHVVKVGSDVNFLILEVLPRLKPGVIIHFHDISLPYEYPEAYVTNPRFRMFWNEAYLLQAFLACNNQFEILLAMNFLQTRHTQVFCQAFSKFDLSKNWANSGSFWIRRRLS